MKIKILVKSISYLIASISIFAIFKYISIGYFTLFIATMILSCRIEIEKRLLLNIFAVVSILFTLKALSIENFIIPILHSLMILLSIKFLEVKKYRDYMQIYLLSLFLIAGFALLSLNIIFLLYLFIILILLSLATIFLTYFEEDENLILDYNIILTISYKTFFIFLLSLPIAIIIFIILPRIETPFFNFFNSYSAVTGFSNKIQLGDVATIQEDNSVIFRAKMKKISSKDLYWRGIVLDKFNGKEWVKSKKNINEKFNIKSSKLTKQIIFLEPYYNNYLFGLDKPVYISVKKAFKYKDLTFQYFKVLDKRLKYKVYSVITKKIYVKKINNANYLQIPDNLSNKIVKISKKYNNIDKLINYFKKLHLKYSLFNLPVTNKPIEDFLFKYKKGNCEYFASSFALLLRLINIPSRIVAGYKGGLYSNLGKYYIVTQNNAHVWVEAYIKKNWVRIDPVNFAFNISKQKNKKSSINFKLLIDLINYYWITMFINYDFNKQFTILKNLKNFTQFKIKNFLKIVGISGIFFLLILVIINIFKFKKKDKEKIIVEKFVKTMKKSGYFRKRNETLTEFVNSIEDNVLRKKANDFLKIFYEYYYKDKKLHQKTYKKLLSILTAIEKSK